MNYISSTGQVKTQHPLTAPKSAHLSERLLEGGLDEIWATSDVLNYDDGQYIAEAIRNGCAIAVSNGSYKDRSTAACVIEGPIP
eukprot:3702254-Ditylum_brightwellii.AAC.1